MGDKMSITPGKWEYQKLNRTISAYTEGEEPVFIAAVNSNDDDGLILANAKALYDACLALKEALLSEPTKFGDAVNILLDALRETEDRAGYPF